MKNLIKNFPVFIIVVIVVFILIPIPTILLDILITVNLAFPILILLIVVSAKAIKEFKLLPTAILLSTIFSLAVNINTVRLILTKGADFDGRLIRFISLPLLNSGTTGQIIGYTIFILSTFVLAIIIAKGGTHVSETAVRFTLDNMQVKLMAIVDELRSGAITEEEAELRKKKIQQESDFLCSIDGASKFVSGNAKLVIFTTIVIILAGVLMEYFYRNTSINDTISTYIGFSAGMGVLFMFPPFLLSAVMRITVKKVMFL